MPWRSRIIGFIAIGEVGVIAALLLVAFVTFIEPAFLSEGKVRAILNVASIVGIIAIGSTAGLSAVVAAKLMTALALPEDRVLRTVAAAQAESVRAAS